LSLVNGLLADGWQTVAVGELYDGASQAAQSDADFAADAGHGAAFRGEVAALHTSTKAWVDDAYGAPVGAADAILGISWGGLMVELLAEVRTDLRAFAAHLPATKPAVMTEFSGDNVTALHVSPLAVDDCPGWISYSEADTRVGYTDTQTVANAMRSLNAAVQVVDYPTLGHTTNTTVVNDILAFFAALP
jgi:hypothetical protein